MHAPPPNPPVFTSYRSVPGASPRADFKFTSAKKTDVFRGRAGAFTWKRILDVTLILASLPIVLPVVGMAALWVKSVSNGPAFFRQERIGRNGRKFTIYKLRSMEQSADPARHRNHVRRLAESDRPMTKLDQLGDSRFIPGGRFLRSAGVDELPQLMNVFVGEMSLVGPRPCLPYEYEFYPPRQRQRFDVPPGLTGLWQVSGKNTVSFREMKAMDLYYSRNASLLVDLAILSKTPVAVGRQILEDFVDMRDRSHSGTEVAELVPLMLRPAKSE